MPRYAISTLWVKHESGGISNKLRSEIVTGVSHNDAVGIHISSNRNKNEMKGFDLSIFTVIEIPDQEARQDES